MKNNNSVKEHYFCSVLKYSRKNEIAFKCSISYHFFPVAVKIEDLKLFNDKMVIIFMKNYTYKSLFIKFKKKFK